MPYPLETPTVKHELVGPRSLINNFHEGVLDSQSNFPSTATLFEALEQPPSPDLKMLSPVYSYPDGPTEKLSRALIMIGVADTSLSVIRKLISGDSVPSCLHMCTIGVKRADGVYASHIPRREDLESSLRFAKFMRQLRKEGCVAIIGLDKLGRFGILSPMALHDDFLSDTFDNADEFAATCYVGNVEKVKEFLSQRSSDAPPLPPPESDSGLWMPPGNDGGGSFGGADVSDGLWQPPTSTSSNGMDFGAKDSGDFTWHPSSNTSGQKRKHEDDANGASTESKFHSDSGAAAADAFYSGLTRSLDTRADSRLFHMRAFNGWVKATQIQELDPKTKQKGKKATGPLRVLDLACGKGGDLGKWVLHARGVSNYVGVDVARGSLRDAAIRARQMKKLKRCTFTCADLGADVPGRLRSPKHKQMQKLSSWSLQSEPNDETGEPVFELVRGGGISLNDKFDVVSIQFAIHYMMSSRDRARRFFQTVSELLEIGGNLVATTIDARVVLDRMIDLGIDFHFDQDSEHDRPSQGAVVKVGGGACRLQFEDETIRKLFTPNDKEEDLYGLQYTFTLVEGSDHAAGVGDAVNLPEWLTPIPALKALASEAGLELESAENFHEFYVNRRNPSAYPLAHNALYNMKVLDRNGSISMEEWEVSRLYAAIKFRKVRESTMVLDDVSDEEEDTANNNHDDSSGHPSKPVQSDEGPASKLSAVPPSHMKLLPVAMMKAKSLVGKDAWEALSSEEKKRRTQIELAKMT